MAWSNKQHRDWYRNYRKTREGYLRTSLSKIKSRCKTNGIPFDLTYEFLDLIAGERCPVFGTEFIWETPDKGHGPGENSPSLDRVVPELGYVQGNVVFISFIANKIKQDVTEKELYAVADWLHDKRKEVLNALKDKHTQLPGAGDTAVKDNAASRPVHGARPG